jgi:hypothetical protein
MMIPFETIFNFIHENMIIFLIEVYIAIFICWGIVIYCGLKKPKK